MGTGTILVVDDERKIRDLVRSYLELEGDSVLLADTGERALESASRSDPDLVVLDLGLSDLAGEEVARTLRTGPNVPIIVLTAKAAEDDRVTGLRLGADDYLAKPFSLRELVARGFRGRSRAGRIAQRPTSSTSRSATCPDLFTSHGRSSRGSTSVRGGPAARHADRDWVRRRRVLMPARPERLETRRCSYRTSSSVNMPAA